MIGLCTHRGISTHTFKSLIEALDIKNTVVNDEADIARSRSIVMTDFLEKTDDDVLLMVDDDIVFNKPIYDRIIEKCRETKSVVSGMYPTRVGNMLAINASFFSGTTFRINGDQLIEIKYASGGFLAIHRDVIEKVKDMVNLHDDKALRFYVFFTRGWEDGIYLTEDWYFSALVRKAGFKIYLDPIICLGHVGDKIFTIMDVMV